MAAKVKASHNGKEKSGSSPSTPEKIDVSNGRRTPKSSVSGLPNQDFLIPSEKLTPNYLKPTISFSNEVCKHANRQAPVEVTLKRLPSGKSLNKPQSPSQIKKTPLSPSPKAKLLRSLSSSSRSAVSPRSNSDKMLKDGKIQALAKTGSFKREENNARRREARDATTKSPSEHKKSNTTSDRPNEEDLADEVVVEMVYTTDTEHGHLEIPPTQDQAPSDPVDSELKIICNGKPEARDEADSTTEEVEDMIEDSHGKDEEPQNDDGVQTREDSEESIDIDSEDGIYQRVIIQRVRAVPTDFSDEEKATKLKFRQGKEIDSSEERDDMVCKRLKFKVREGDAEGVEYSSKPDSENVVLKHQEVQGKKEALAFNDMIEETASKLVEERKSMVKALVGAFETVILLQEPDSQVPQAAADDGNALKVES